ncbi:MAG TPA: ATP-binding protein [Clostridia bacterium]|nr:ATP-binding protein [Clostridia bacterium]
MNNNSETTTVVDKKNLRPTIGVIKNNRVSYREMLQYEGLKRAAQKNDVNLIIYSGGMINYSYELESTAIYDFIDTNKLDGLIIWTGNINWFSNHEETMRFVYKYDFIPVISLEAKIEGITSIVWDDFNAMREAMIHLIEVHKYRRIAFIRGLGSHIGVELRFKAYLHTLEEYGIPIDEEIIFDDLFYVDDDARKLESLWMSGIDAIVAFNDLNARFVTTMMEKKSLPFIPIVGFDDEVEGEADKPFLTTVHPPFVEMGSRGMEVILEKIKGVQVPELEVLPCSLIVRRSCGCNTGSVMKRDLFREKVRALNIPEVINNNISSVEMESFVRHIIDIPDDIDISWATGLLPEFFDEVEREKGQVFVNHLEKILIQKYDQNYDMEIFSDTILMLYFFADFLYENNRAGYLKAQIILRQATNLIADMRISLELNKRMQGDRRYFYIISFKHIISNAVDMNDLLERIKSGFKMIGISSCFISLYENKGTSTEKARLILAYNDETCMDIDRNISVFPSVQLVPDGILSYVKRLELILKPLYFKKRQIGFVLFGDTLKDLSEYEQLSEFMSTAINGVMMIEDMENKALELKETNNELESAYSTLKENQQKLLASEKMASLGRLTAGIAHEMNTPLAALRTSLKELEELVDEYNISIENPQVLPDDHRSIAQDMQKFLNLAERSAEKSAGFIKGIKAQTTNMNTSNSQVFNVAGVISDALSVLDFALKKGNCKLATNYDNSVKLHGDPKRLVQVITNLVINSIDACKPNGGNISIILENNGDGFARLTVRDTGCGIPEEILPRIFDPMFSTKPFGEGTGLGLSIVHDIVNEFKGSISVESKNDLTSFEIYLPIVQGE